MDKIINKKIAEWLGFKVVAGSVFLWDDDRGWYRDSALLNYAASDADASALLPVLVERAKESYYLISRFDGEAYVWACVPWHIVVIDGPTTIPDDNFASSVAQAISAAVVKLIESI